MYKSGYTLHLYQILEDDLVDFLKYISIDYYRGDTRKEIFSPKLSELLIRIGSQIDVFFRNWDIVISNNTGAAKKNFSFGNYKVVERQIVSTSNLRVTCTILNRKATLRVDWY